MPRAPSYATQLRTMRAELKRTAAEAFEWRRQCYAFRARATKAEQECAEWRRRFDLLLEKQEPRT